MKEMCHEMLCNYFSSIWQIILGIASQMKKKHQMSYIIVLSNAKNTMDIYLSVEEVLKKLGATQKLLFKIRKRQMKFLSYIIRKIRAIFNLKENNN